MKQLLKDKMAVSKKSFEHLGECAGAQVTTGTIVGITVAAAVSFWIVVCVAVFGGGV